MEHQVADTQQAETTSPEGAQAGESTSVQAAGDVDFNFDDAFGLTPGEKPASTPSAGAEQATSEQSSQPVAAESKPDDDGEEPEGEQPKLSRRQAAEQERQQKQAELVQRAEAAEARTADLERQLSGQQTEQERLYEQFAAEEGPEAEYQRLKELPSTALTFEEQEKLDGWKQARQENAPRLQYAFDDITRRIANSIDLTLMGLGIDKALISQQPHPAALIQLAVNHVSTALKAEHAAALAAANEQVEQLQAELRDARTKAAGSVRQLEVGGVSAAARGNGHARFDPSKTADELFRAAF